MKYFDIENSINSKCGTDIEPILNTIALRYIGQNPEQKPVFRIFNEGSFKRNGEYRYILNFDEKYPKAPINSLVYAWTKVWSDSSSELGLSMNCNAPIVVYCNGEKTFKSPIDIETDNRKIISFKMNVVQGWNDILLRCKKVPSGFGCTIGTSSFKGNPLHFLVPSPERDGQEGWIFTEPMTKELTEFYKPGQTEDSTSITWNPRLNWDNDELEKGQFERIYGFKENHYGFAWTKGLFNSFGNSDYEFKGDSFGAISIYLDGEKIYDSDKKGEFNKTVNVEYGSHDIVIKCSSSENGWGFNLQINGQAQAVQMESPFLLKGAKDPYVYIGAFNESQNIKIESVTSTDVLFETADGEIYWRTDMPGAQVRVYLENELFGKWNYPLGVTLYGMLHCGVMLGDNKIIEYVKKHVELCTSYYKYSLWDRKKYGASGINSQLSGIDSLDDCGAFGSTMLEVMMYTDIKGGKKVADDIADYITHKQARLEDGALYRKNCYSVFMEDTMWADDLYMSIPFLGKYYKLTGEISYIDDAARQILLFKKYLFMPKLSIMSHVYNFRYDAPTGVAWGRGNGWVIFSLSEILAILPKNHENREELLELFNTLCKGYVKLQGSEGMWHQVLTDEESYIETSCTSMFIYAFSRGIRYGWVENGCKLSDVVFKAFEGLTRIAIEQGGNIYGVCRGSGYSYDADYYKNDLSWRLNDTHGIGIVMLAAIEVSKLKQYLKDK